MALRKPCTREKASRSERKQVGASHHSISGRPRAEFRFLSQLKCVQHFVCSFLTEFRFVELLHYNNEDKMYKDAHMT